MSFPADALAKWRGVATVIVSSYFAADLLLLYCVAATIELVKEKRGFIWRLLLGACCLFSHVCVIRMLFFFNSLAFSADILCFLVNWYLLRHLNRCRAM